MNGWFSYASKFIHVQILLTPNTLKNGCLHICKKESDDPKPKARMICEHYVFIKKKMDRMREILKKTKKKKKKKK